MLKVSTPGDRKFALHEIPKLMTELEIAMPQNWNTMVVHVFTFHSVLLMMMAGPFCVSNMFKVSAPSHSIFHQVNIRRTTSDNRTASVNRTPYVFLLSYTHRLSSFTPSSRDWPGALKTRWLRSATTTCCSSPRTSPGSIPTWIGWPRPEAARSARAHINIAHVTLNFTKSK